MTPRPFHHQRPLAACAAAYGAGVAAGVSFAWRPWLYGLGLLCAVVAAALLRRLGRRRAAGFMACALFLGLLLGGAASHPALPAEGRCRVYGVVAADITLRENGTAAGYLEQVRYEGEESGALSRAYWTYTPDEEQPFLPREGDAVSFSARLYHPSGQENPYGFDFRMYLLEKGAAVGLNGAADAEILSHPGRGLFSLPYQARKYLLEKTEAVFGQDSALPEALLLGERDSLPQETQQSFADAGVAHLLAVSGLHVSLLAGVLLLPLRRLLSPEKRLPVMAAFLLVYCALLDFSAPVARASILTLLLLYRQTVRRSPDALTALCAAFFLILFVRPLDLFSASFQLSFCAVLGIVAFSHGMETLLKRVRPRFLREGWITAFSATAGSALPTIQIFHRFSLVGLAVNPFLCALFSVLLPLYALTLLLGCVSLPLGCFLGRLLGPVTRGLVRAVDWLGALPLATVRLPALPWYCVAAVAISCALLTRFILGNARMKALLAAFLTLVSFGVWGLTANRDVRFLQLSASQADAALLLDGRETVVIDAGAYGGDMAAYLLSTGRQADRVILTHLHSDHCMGLVQLLSQGIEIGEIFLPVGALEQQISEDCLALMEDLAARGVPIRFLKAGDALSTARTTLEVTWPREEALRPGQDANRYSLALLCDLDGVKLMTAGDLTGDYEMYAARDADVLKVAHHGSKTSTGADFLKAVSPQAAWITAGGSSASLPHPDTLERLREAGAMVYDTSRCGAVMLTVKNGAGVLTTFLSEREK